VGESLRAILYPKTVAFIGVSSRADSLSGKLLANLFAAGYTGAVYPVNPKVSSLRTLRCFPAVGAIPDPIDLALVMVPRDAVPATVDECLQAGVKGLVVITAGFREMGEEGAGVERKVVEKVRRAGVPMIGPNCMGVMNLEPAVRLDATFSPTPAHPGAVAFASHSGALGVALIGAVHDIGLGFSHFVSLGNCADVNVCDLLELWEKHEATKAIMLYLEEVEEPRRFLALASRITRKKPIIALKSGRTAEGQRAASSHTGALAAGDAAVDALLRQAGVIRCASLEEMLDLARAFERLAPAAGRRIAVVSNAGGPAIVATDALVAQGLSLASFTEATKAELRSFLPAEAAVGNPVDMLPGATPEHYRRAVELVGADGGVDAALVITVTPPMGDPLAVAEGVAAASGVTAKPVIPVFMTSPQFYARARCVQGLPPVFRVPESAARALGALARQAERSARPEVPAAESGPSSRAPSIKLRRRGQRYLSPGESLGLMDELGIAVARWRVVDAAAVVSAAREIGFPVVLKAAGERLVHKSELGAVAVDLRDENELGVALSVMQSRLATAGVEAEAYLLQAMVPGGREAILGLTRDPVMGPLVMCGLGGVAVEVWRDVSFRLAPIDETDAGEMLEELRGKVLLGAFRGRPPADVAALRQALVRLSALAAVDEIAECDLNPILVLDEGQGCIAVDVRVLLSP